MSIHKNIITKITVSIITLTIALSPLAGCSSSDEATANMSDNNTVTESSTAEPTTESTTEPTIEPTIEPTALPNEDAQAQEQARNEFLSKDHLQNDVAPLY